MWIRLGQQVSLQFGVVEQLLEPQERRERVLEPRGLRSGYSDWERLVVQVSVAPRALGIAGFGVIATGGGVLSPR